VFDNILGQDAAVLLARDIAASALAPSVLFRGPAASGKGTAALELARGLSCARGGEWNCACPDCARHRLLYHPDLLALGARSFSPEIAAAARVFSREYADTPARLFFIRAARKLLLRAGSALWEDDPGAKKIAPLVEALDADLNEVLAFHGAADSGGEEAAPPEDGWAEKIAGSILKNAWKLEAEGIPGQIPVAQIRRASFWCRMAPLSRRKVLLIENAERMQDGARNALLKILEEPPPTAVIVLCSAHPAALLPTVLSRLRPYYFARRDAAVEREVIRRVFRARTDPEGPARNGSLIFGYLERFLPVSGETLAPLAVLFAASLAARARRLLQAARNGAAPPALLAARAARMEEAARGAALPAVPATAEAVLRAIREGADNFEAPGVFERFLEAVLEAAGGAGAAEEDGAIRDIWSGVVNGAAVAVRTYNMAVPLILERMGTEFLQRVRALYGIG
jgi:DNA polymerase-3 subunit gamma/tau